MAARNIQVIISVRDKATEKLKKLERNTKDAGKAAARSKTDWTKFNRTLFTATAMIAMLVRGFNRLQRSITMGAELDRLDTQFSRVLGPSGAFLSKIRETTDAAVDSIEAMKAGIALRTSGITKNVEDTSKIIAQAAAVSRRAGVDTTEGIKRVVKFFKSGSISALEFLNLVRTTNPALTAQLEIMKKAGGVLGGTFSMQQKVLIGRRALNLAALESIKGQEDLADVTKLLTTDFDFFRRTIGRFLGTALTPLMKKFSNFFFELTAGIEKIRKTDKNMLFLIKTLVIGTAAVTALVGAIATLRLSLKALAFGGLGLGKVISLIVGLGGAFLAVTDGAESFMERLSTFGAFFKGIYQLVANFNRDTGKALMDTELMKKLEEKGILGLVKNIARITNLAIITVKDFVAEVKNLAEWTDYLVGGSFKKVMEMLSNDGKPWSMNLISDEQDAKVSRLWSAAKLLTGIAGVKFAFGGLKNVFSNIFGKRPKGTVTDPLYTVPVTAAFKSAEGILGKVSVIASTVKAVILAIGLGWIIGEVVNKAIDTWWTGKNVIGQKTHPLDPIWEMWERGGKEMEKGFYPKLGSFDPDSFRKKDEFENFFKTANIQRGKKTDTVSMPTSEVKQEDYLNSIAQKMGELEGAQRRKLEESYRAALAPTGEGGSTITDEEFKRMATAFKMGLDSSETRNDIKRNFETRPAALKSTRR